MPKKQKKTKEWKEPSPFTPMPKYDDMATPVIKVKVIPCKDIVIFEVPTLSIFIALLTYRQQGVVYNTYNYLYMYCVWSHIKEWCCREEAM